jgi:hypothetical protein
MEIISQIILALIFIFVGFIIGLLVGMVIWRGKEDASSTQGKTPLVIKRPLSEEPRSPGMIAKPNIISKESGSGETPAVMTPPVLVKKPDISPLSQIPDPINDPSKKVYRSVAEAVDEILQEKLITSPYAGKNIRLTQGTKGEVVVWVGAVRYNEVDAIPDLAIRQLIRDAGAEWEHRGG